MNLSPVDIFAYPIMIILTFWIAVVAGRKLGVTQSMTLKIVLYHTFFCIVYVWYSSNYASDVNGYMFRAQYGLYNWTPGTHFVTAVTALLTQTIGLGRYSAFLPFNLLGCLSLIILYSMLRTLWQSEKGLSQYIPVVIVFLPGLSFWSSSIGKDAPALFATCLALYAFLNVSKRLHLLIFAILIAFLVRPYFALMIIGASGIALIMGSNTRAGTRLFMTALTIAAMAIVLPFSLNYVGLQDAKSLTDITEYIDLRAGYNQIGGGAVDITTLSFPMKMFTYLFRPLFYDARSLFQLVSSAENLVVLGLVIYYFRNLFSAAFRNRQPVFIYALVLFLSGWIVFALTTANLGISVRQKTMILPPLFFLIGSVVEMKYRKRPKRSPAHI